MTNKAAAKFTVAQHVLAERAANGERGASAMEYVGMLIVAAIIVGAIIGVIKPDTITKAVQNAVNTILNQGK